MISMRYNAENRESSIDAKILIFWHSWCWTANPQW